MRECWRLHIMSIENPVEQVLKSAGAIAGGKRLLDQLSGDYAAERVGLGACAAACKTGGTRNRCDSCVRRPDVLRDRRNGGEIRSAGTSLHLSGSDRVSAAVCPSGTSVERCGAVQSSRHGTSASVEADSECGNRGRLRGSPPDSLWNRKGTLRPVSRRFRTERRDRVLSGHAGGDRFFRNSRSWRRRRFPHFPFWRFFRRNGVRGFRWGFRMRSTVIPIR